MTPPRDVPAWVQEIDDMLDRAFTTLAPHRVRELVAALSECVEALRNVARESCADDATNDLGLCTEHYARSGWMCGRCMARRVLTRYESGEIGR